MESREGTPRRFRFDFLFSYMQFYVGADLGSDFVVCDKFKKKLSYN